MLATNLVLMRKIISKKNRHKKYKIGNKYTNNLIKSLGLFYKQVNIEKKNKNIRGKKINASSINKTMTTLTKKSKKFSINSLYLTLANWPPSR